MKSIKVRSSSSEINAPQPKAPRLEDKPSWSPGKMMATCMDTMQTMMVTETWMFLSLLCTCWKRCCPNIHKGFWTPPSQQNPASSSTKALPCLPAPDEAEEKTTEENALALVQDPKKKPDQKTLEDFEAEDLSNLKQGLQLQRIQRKEKIPWKSLLLPKFLKRRPCQEKQEVPARARSKARKLKLAKQRQDQEGTAYTIQMLWLFMAVADVEEIHLDVAPVPKRISRAEGWMAGQHGRNGGKGRNKKRAKAKIQGPMWMLALAPA